MSVGTLRKIIIEKCGFITYEEVRENAFQGKKKFKKFKKLFYSIGRNNSTLSKEGEDPERIES
jgi:hypothetical protein